MPIRAAILFGMALVIIGVMITTPWSAMAQRNRSLSHDLTNPQALGEMVAVHDQRLNDTSESIKEIKKMVEDYHLPETLQKLQDGQRETADAVAWLVRLVFVGGGSLIVFFISSGWKTLNRRVAKASGSVAP